MTQKNENFRLYWCNDSRVNSLSICLPLIYVCMYACMYVFIYVCICMYVCFYICLYMYVYMYICTFLCMFLCMYACLYVFMHVCMYVHVELCFTMLTGKDDTKNKKIRFIFVYIGVMIVGLVHCRFVYL